MIFILYTIFYFFAISGIFVISALVFLRSKSREYQFFALFSVLLGLWLLLQFGAQLLGEHFQAVSHILLHVAIALPAFFVVSFYLFVKAYRGSKKASLLHFLPPASFGVVSTLLPNTIIESAHITQIGISITVRPLYYIIVAYVAGYALWAARDLLISLRGKNTSPGGKYRTKLILFAIIQALIIILFAVLVLPDEAIGQLMLTVACLTMVIIFAYAIIRHRLFDIRLIIVRALGYLLSLTTLAGAYTFITFGLVAQTLGFSSTSAVQQAVYILIALVLAITFAPLKRFFDKITQAVFYRDAYNSQEVIDHFSGLLVKTIDIDKLAHSSARILQNAIRAQYVGVVLVTEAQKVRAIIEGARPHADGKLYEELHKHKEQIIVQDELEDRTSKLFKTLHGSDCAVAARLETHGDFIGHIIFGFKVSGSAYTTQDIDLIRIIADELAVATQNALRFEEISRFNITLKEEIAQATAELRLSNRKLQQLDKAKDEFISMASHQLRTPLTSVKGYLSMVLEGDAGKIDPNQRKLIEEAFASSQRMVYLIGDFLNVSRLQTGRFVLETKPVTLPNIVKDEIEQLASTAARRDVRMEYHSPTHFPVLELDETKIRQVIMNFIDNAIFYSNTGGTIIIELFNTSDKVTFRVKDNGIGVPALERPKLFTKFFRATNARKVRPDGTGIGLFMAKKVILAHGGTVIFESQQGKGSTFGFSLPMNRHKPLENNIEKLEQ